MLQIDRVKAFEVLGLEYPYGLGVEVGTFKGEFAKEILNVWKGTLVMVDVWRPLGDEYLDASNHKNHADAYYQTMENVKGHEDRAIMLRADSKVGSTFFANESLDFVYIDANHAYDYVKEDIELWYPKVKKGGILMGHDYINMDWYNDPNFLENGKDKHIYSADGFYFGVFGVNPAVDEFCATNNYEKLITKEWFGTWIVKK